MATRAEKIYKTNSLKAFNNLLNYAKDYIDSAKRPTKREIDFIKSVTVEIDLFFKKNNISDEELQQAVKKGK